MTSDWMGTVDAMRVLVHIGEGDAGSSMDALDAGRVGMPISVKTFDRGVLEFEAWTIDGVYKGRISRDGRTIEGTWRLDEESSPLVLRRIQPSPIDGIWEGTLSHETYRLRLVFYAGSSPEGLVAAMQSRDQNDAMVPMSAVKLIGGTVVMEADAIGARFDGKVDEGFGSIDGIWTQGGGGLRLSLKRVAKEEELSPLRPQEPAPPYPYREEEVRYKNEAAGIELAGTLTVPEGEGPFPAALLIAGSGALDRDESMYGHRPFLVLADFLTRHGMAVLRADKRGVRESGGAFAKATTAEFADDADAGLAYLKARREVDGARIGMVGHSEGGLIACILAARNMDVAFAVLMAAPGLTGWELAGQQARRMAEIHGLDADEAERRNRDAAALLRNEKDEGALRRKLEQMFSYLAEPQRSEMITALIFPWQRHFAGLNPADYLEKVTCPVLALNGEHDVLVESTSNLAAIRGALERGRNRDFEVAEMAGLNHLFQTCETSSGTEYGQLEETLAEGVMERIVSWIRGRGTGLKEGVGG